VHFRGQVREVRQGNADRTSPYAPSTEQDSQPLSTRFEPMLLAVWAYSTVFTRSNPGIVGTNPTQGMDVCVRAYYVSVVLCVGSGLATG
jgi:hypothetical protein